MISIKHDFIFIHPPKTGGNTIHNILKDYYDPIISTLIRNNVNGPKQAVAFATKRHIIDGALTPCAPNKHWPYRDAIEYYGNVPFKELHPNLEFECLKDLRLISTIRNPYERIVSFYSFRKNREKATVENLKQWYHNFKIPTCVSHWSGFEPNFVVRMEHFEEDVRQLMDYLGISNNLSKIEKVNASKWGKAKNSYHSFYKDSNGKYDEEFIVKIRQDHSDDFEFSKKLFVKPYEF